MNIRQITIKDQINIKKIYFDSIKSIDNNLYTNEQKFVWARQAWDNSEFTNSINKGKGWIISENNNSIGFAVRYPQNRLSLLYLKGNSKRKGYGTKLLKHIEKDAKKEGLNYLKTEASLISYKLLLKEKWKIVSKEKIVINGVTFDRFRMKKNLI